MSVSARTILKILGLCLALPTVLYLTLFFIVRSSSARSWLETALSERTGATVQVASLRLLFPLRISADGVEVSKPEEFQLTSRRMTATITPLDLFSKTLHRLDLENPILRLDLQAFGKPADGLTGQFALGHLNVEGGKLVLTKDESVILALPDINMDAQNFNLGGEAAVDLRADVPQLDGEVQVKLTGRPSALASEIVIREKKAPRLSEAQNLTSGSSERLRLRAQLHFPEQQAADVTLDGKFQNFGKGDAKISGTLVGRVELNRQFTGAQFTGQLSLQRLPPLLASALHVTFTDGPAVAKFTGSFDLSDRRLKLTSLQLDSPLGNGIGEGEIVFVPRPQFVSAKLTWRDAPIEIFKGLLPDPFNGWSLAGRGEIRGELTGAWNAPKIEGTARSDHIELGGDSLKVATVQLVAPFTWDSPTLRITEAQIQARGLDYSERNRWQLGAARLQVHASAEHRTGEPLKISGSFETLGGKFHSPDNAKIGENLSFSGAFEATSRSRADTVGVSGKIRVHAGELLWDKFFGDLKTRTPELVVDADYSRTMDRLDCRRCNLSMIDIGAIELRGSIDRVSGVPLLHLSARSANLSPEGVFQFFLRETYNRQFPLLDQLAFGGRLAFQTELRGPLDHLAAQGELAFESGEMRVKSWNWQIGPLNLSLPFQVLWPDAENPPSGPPRPGIFFLEKARLGSQVLGPIKVPLSLNDNALRFQEPLRFNLFGGEISIAKLSWPDVIHEPKQLSFALQCEQVKLQELTQALDWPPFSGTLTGSIPEVQTAGNTLKTNGEIRAELFGGRLRMNKLEVENPFSSLASIKLNAELSGIQLQQLSKTFAFGRISGILEGTVDDLVITDGQVAQFRADLHSVDRGTEQRISVEALNKITVLSSGQNASGLYSGLAGFFDSFRYSKLGFRAVLRNDRLTLKGVESRGDEEYLVVGSFLPPTVNIVSHTQNIAFSELMRRLKRVRSEGPKIQ